MKTYQKIILSSALIAASAISCYSTYPQNPPKVLEGKVTKIIRRNDTITETTRGYLPWKKTQMTRKPYVLVISAFEKEYHISVADSNRKPLSALEEKLQVCDDVKITADRNTIIWQDGIGSTGSDTIEIKKARKE